jgi:hypothetical protein
MRVNARLTAEEASKLDYLVRIEGKSVTEVIRASIVRYYDEARATHAAASGALERTGFIGCAEGEPDLSRSYKRRLTDSLATKHGHR